jgi:hypothetical protein
MIKKMMLGMILLSMGTQYSSSDDMMESNLDLWLNRFGPHIAKRLVIEGVRPDLHAIMKVMTNLRFSLPEIQEHDPLIEYTEQLLNDRRKWEKDGTDRRLVDEIARFYNDFKQFETQQKHSRMSILTDALADNMDDVRNYLNRNYQDALAGSLNSDPIEQAIFSPHMLSFAQKEDIQAILQEMPFQDLDDVVGFLQKLQHVLPQTEIPILNGNERLDQHTITRNISHLLQIAQNELAAKKDKMRIWIKDHLEPAVRVARGLAQQPTINRRLRDYKNSKNLKDLDNMGKDIRDKMRKDRKAKDY